MKPIKQYDIWIANLGKSRTTDPGKIRPVVIVQTQLLNDIHFPSTVICPVTSQITKNKNCFRVDLEQLDQPSEILIDQIRSIDNRMLIDRLGKLTKAQINQLQLGQQVLLGLILEI